MKNKYFYILLFAVGLLLVSKLISDLVSYDSQPKEQILFPELELKESEESRHKAYLNTLERELHEFNFQKNPVTGEIPLEEKQLELEKAIEARDQAALSRSSNNAYVSRGPSNLGGRTRGFKIDLSDNLSNTILAGGVSSGLFRTTNGGNSWVKVSSNDEIHNVTALAQDIRPGFRNIWYYGTGEWTGNSASLGSPYRGQGIWRSTDSGVTWTQMTGTDSNQTVFDSFFDYINNLQVSPITGELFVAATGKIYRYDGTNFNIELEESVGGVGFTDVTIALDGTVYASLDNSNPNSRGVWTSPTGNGNWTRIAQNFQPSGWASGGNARTVMATAPSNPNILYALYNNGQSGGIEAGLWRYNAISDTWTDFTSKLPDEPGGDLSGNDPFAIQGAYDLVVNVNPVDENFVVIGGTNAYKITNINTDNMFSRIGGYASNQNYALYPNHHPDLHAMEFNPFDPTGSILFTGDDGGVHKTTDIYSSAVTWESLNNNYQTYQFYHVAIDPTPGSNRVLGGTQDNGTPIGGTDFALADNTTMSTFFGGDGVAVGIAPRNNGNNIQIYYGSQNGNMRTNYPNFRTIRPSGSSSQFVTYFYLDPDNTNAIYYAGLSTLYASSDAENVTQFSWNNLGLLPTGENIRTLATTPGIYNSTTSNLFIGGQNGGLFRLTDPQNAFTVSAAQNITPAGASTAPGTVLSGIAIHPSNPDIMLVVYANYGIQNIFITTEATASSPSWTLVERNLDSHSIRSAAIAEIGGETIYYVGTARGLYSSNDPTSTDWEIEGQNEMGLALISGLVYRPSDQKLLIGTHGNGMFETTIQTLSINDSNLNGIDFRVYPNPTSDYLNLRGNNLNGKTIDYRISNLLGQVITEGKIDNSVINIQNLTKGTYILTVDIEGSTDSIKFLKE